MEKLSNTAYVILGMLDLHPMAGYDIKAFADLSTRHFWAMSYGQIYPELKALEAGGLIESEDSAVGSRQRTVYRLTDSGHSVLRGWLGDHAPSTQEIRDEMLLRLFFSDSMPAEQTAALLEAMVDRHRAAAAGLNEHRPMAAQHGGNLKLSVLEFGVDYHTFLAGWFARLRDEIRGEASAPAE